MAKVSSARPSSRQSQTAPQEATGRTTRSTRSASREPSEQPTLQRGGKGKGNAQKKGGKKGKNAGDLTTVEEDAIREQLQAEVAADEHTAPENRDQVTAVEDADHARRISQHSAMSGTTAKTSFSQEEMDGMDRDVMVDVLPSLSSAADELARLLVPADLKSHPVVRKEIRTAGTKHNKLYNNRLASIDIHKHSFGSTEYIQPSFVLRALLGVPALKDVPQGPWRPDPVIYKINLAQMLRSMLIVLPGNTETDVSVEGYNAMEALDHHFGSSIAGPGFRQNAFHLCLSILIQLAIARVAGYMADPNFIPSQAIKHTLYEDSDGELMFRHRNVLHMSEPSMEDQATYTDMVRQLSEQLLDGFNDDDHDTWMPALGALREQYPWEQFVDHIIQYYLERKQELDEQIAAVGGIDQIMLGLSEEVEKRAREQLAEVKRQSFSRPGGTPKKAFGKNAVRALKAREKQAAAHAIPTPEGAPVAQMTGTAAAQAEQAEAPTDDGWQRQEDDEHLFLPPAQTAAQSTARSTLEALSDFQNTQRQNANKGKGRSFVDRQDGAQRVAWDDSQLTQYQVPQFQYPTSSAPEQGPYFQSPQRNPGKRPYEAINEEPEDFEPTQDQGFEVDNRDPTAADERRREVAQQQASRAPQPRFSALASGGVPGPASSMPAGAGSASQSPSKRRRKNPGSTIPDPPPPFDPEDYTEIPREERMQRAKVAARYGTVRASQLKPSQVRQPWTADEENALIDLIEEEGEEGISYAKLKSFDDTRAEGARLGRRSAEDLRFKARNMKETFLKGRSVLPQNFNFIVLDKKAITKLHSLGIQYHQDRIRGGVVDVMDG